MDTGDPKFVLVYANEDESNMGTTNFAEDQNNVTWGPWSGKCKQEPVVVQSNVVVTSAPTTVDSTDSRVLQWNEACWNTLYPSGTLTRKIHLEDFASSTPVPVSAGIMSSINAVSTPSTVQPTQTPVSSTVTLASAPVVVSSGCSTQQISAPASTKCIQLPLESFSPAVSSGTATLQISLAPGQANTATLQQVQQAVAAVAQGLPGGIGGQQKILLQFHPSGTKAIPLTAFTTVLPTAQQQVHQQQLQTQQIQLHQVQPQAVQQQQPQQPQQQFQQVATQQLSLAAAPITQSGAITTARTVQLQPLTTVTGSQGQTMQLASPLTVQALHPSGTILQSSGTQFQLQALPQALLNGGVTPVAMELAQLQQGAAVQEMKPTPIAVDMVDGAGGVQLTSAQLVPAAAAQPMTVTAGSAGAVQASAQSQSGPAPAAVQPGPSNGTATANANTGTALQPGTPQSAPTSSTGVAAAANANTGAAPSTTTPNKPFACQYCPKSFHNKQQLIVHIRTHTGERPFACKTCGKAYRQKGQLTRHMMDHTGLRPYPCLWCSKAFKRKEHLHIHTKMVHKKVPVNNPPVNPVK